MGTALERILQLSRENPDICDPIPTTDTGHLSKRDVHDNGLFQDSEPEQGTQLPRRGLPLTDAQRDGTLPNPMAAAR